MPLFDLLSSIGSGVHSSLNNLVRNSEVNCPASSAAASGAVFLDNRHHHHSSSPSPQHHHHHAAHHTHHSRSSHHNPLGRHSRGPSGGLSVETVASPTTGRPIAGAGTWLVNKPDGYYVGRLRPGEEFVPQQETPLHWHFGRAPSVEFCAWALPGAVPNNVAPGPAHCSVASGLELTHRRSFGQDYNAPAHVTGDGTFVHLLEPATLYYNYFRGQDFADGGGHWADPAGSASPAVAYRYTTLDGEAAVVRDPVLGWGFLPADAVGRPEQVYNDDD